MELVEVNGLDAQRPQRGLKLLANVRGGESLGAVQELVEVMAELGGDEPARAVVAAEIIADQAFGKVVAIAFGGVNEVDAELRRLVEDGVRLGLGKGAAPFAAKLPGAEADDRNPQAGAAENSIAHGQSLPQIEETETGIIVVRTAEGLGVLDRSCGLPRLRLLDTYDAPNYSCSGLPGGESFGAGRSECGCAVVVQ